MTCSNLIEGYTNAKYIFRGVSRFRQSFTCGRCSDCIRKQRTDWRVRTYYESRNILKKPNSFILFDTLTYSDEHIKRYSDIFPDLDIPELLNKTSFCRSDVQKFFKRLRINLRRAGYIFGSNELRYILTSEYGSDEKVNGFQRTHRPHYHVLFFVSFPISPIDFSRNVSRAWHLGKTDGVRPSDDCSDCPVRKYCKGYCLYQSPEYVQSERLVSSSSPSNTMKCVNYVTKYISKDMYNSDILLHRVETLWKYLSPDYRTNLLEYRKFRRFCSQVLPFHLQSQFFGYELLRDETEKKYIVATNQVHLPTSDASVVRSVALPRYYQRHLYYEYQKIDGRVKWSLTDYGLAQKVRQLDNKIISFMRDFRVFDSHIKDGELFQLSLYKNVYRGTLSDYQSLLLPYRGYYRKLLLPHDERVEKPLYCNYNTKRDKLSVGSFLSPSYSLSSDGEIIFKGKQLHKEFIPFDGYELVNDKTCPYWNGFDRRIAAFERWRKSIATSQDDIMRVVDKNTDYYRQLGLLKQ